jgi:L-aminopeptidase/D-esterase-like protein
MVTGITDINGLKVGVATDLEAITGLTVILAEDGARTAVEVRGSAPGTRETDLLRPGQLVDEVQAIVLTGGSAFGLDAVSGVVKYLEEKGCGFPVGEIRVPIVPAAVLYDLSIGSSKIRPDAQMGFEACLKASTGRVPEGSVGAGTGSTIGKILGIGQSVKGGQGSAALKSGELVVAALVVVNAFGDVYGAGGKLLAGPRNILSGEISKTTDYLLSNINEIYPGNTTLGVVATNAEFDKPGLLKICELAHDGLARCIWPVHTMWDGDTIFAISKGNVRADINLVGLMAAEAVTKAVERAVFLANPLGGIPSVEELSKGKE